MYRLREVERRDMALINQWRNDSEVISCLGAPYRYINPEVDDQWYNSYMHSRNNAVRCVIVGENDEALGLVSLTGIDSVNRSASLHIMIGPSQYRGKGAGTFALRTMIDHAFFNLNLRRIELNVLETNTVALHLYEKLGFVREGKKREAVYKNGAYVDMIVMGLLRHV